MGKLSTTVASYHGTRECKQETTGTRGMGQQETGQESGQLPPYNGLIDLLLFYGDHDLKGSDL